jgi:Glycosyl transferase family 2
MAAGGGRGEQEPLELLDCNYCSVVVGRGSGVQPNACGTSRVHCGYADQRGMGCVIYICIPSYNEQQTAGVVLWKVRQVMADFHRDYHVLFLDDASTDETRQALEPYLRVMPLTVIRHAQRQGYALGVERLLREVARRAPYPKRDVAVVLQADFTEDPDDIPDLVRRIEGGADVANGALMYGESGAPRGFRWTRALATSMARRFRRWPEGVSDPLSGFRAYRVICLKRLFETRDDTPLLRGAGWAVNAELLQALALIARRVDEVAVPARHAARPRESRLRPWRALRELMAFLQNVARGTPAPSMAVAVEELSAESVLDRPAAVLAARSAKPQGRQRSAAGNGAGQRSRRRSGRDGRKRSREERGDGDAAAAAAAAETASPEGSSSSTPSAEAGQAEGAAPQGADDAASTRQAGRRGSRRRRGRRGGRRRKRNDQASPPEGGSGPLPAADG